MYTNPRFSTAATNRSDVPQLGQKHLASPVVDFTAPISKLILTAVLAMVNIATCSIGAAGWVLLIQNNAHGNLAFATCVFFAGLVFTGIIGLAAQVGLLEDIK